MTESAAGTRRKIYESNISNKCESVALLEGAAGDDEHLRSSYISRTPSDAYARNCEQMSRIKLTFQTCTVRSDIFAQEVLETYLLQPCA